jgi:VanZ family protein
MQILYRIIVRNIRVILFHRITVGLLVLYWTALFLGTHLPVRGMSKANDKWLHFLAFSGLSFLLAWAIAAFRPTWRSLAVVLMIAVVYGAMDEATQMLVPQRTADIWDWVANLVGGVAGVACYSLCLTVMVAIWPSLAGLSQGEPEASASGS